MISGELRTLESSGKAWKALASSEELSRALEWPGKLWQAIGSSGLSFLRISLYFIVFLGISWVCLGISWSLSLSPFFIVTFNY